MSLFVGVEPEGATRILYFYQYFSTPKGSWGTRAYEFARRWAKEGDQVTIVTSVYDKSDLRPDRWLSRVEIDGIDVRIINIRLSNKHGLVSRLGSFALYALISCWYALTARADVVLASSGPLTVGIPGLVARYVRRRPLVLEVRDLWPEGAIQLGVLRSRVAIRLARLLERACYRGATRVVALSPGMASWIAEHHGLEVDVVPNASDNDQVGLATVELPPWARSQPFVVYAGTLGLIDDCGQIVDMAAVLRERGRHDVTVVVIGDGKERAELERRATDLGLDDLHFLGLRPKDEVMQWLDASVCALLVTKDVAFLDTASPNKLFDALAAGAPIVQTTQGWIKDLLHEERCGVTVPSGRPDALADAVLGLVDDRVERDRMAQRARALARTRFDRDHLAGQMRRVLHEAAGVARP